MGWLTLLSLAKLGFYLGVVSFIGMNAMRLFLRHGRNGNLTIDTAWHKPVLVVQWSCLLISLVCLAAVVPLSAGMLLDEGLTGLTDSLMLQISWESTVGEQTQVRLLAVVMALVCTYWGGKIYAHPNLSKAWLGAWLLTSAVFAASFTFSGHTAEASWLAKGLVALHVLMAGWWLGSLYPLIRLCRLQDVVKLQNQLHRYGNQAAVWVGLLLTSGVALLMMLLLNISGEVNTTYLVVMGGKLVLVTVMLCFAAYHKWRLVANMHATEDCQQVKKSIVAEAVVGTLVIAVTATLTSSFGLVH
ncbi:MAG: hypothetical protein GYB58_01855 [Gammaproteobacteria bacterium]|nr:hypothetical protein [Gammaproteobacteria bacterium]